MSHPPDSRPDSRSDSRSDSEHDTTADLLMSVARSMRRAFGGALSEYDVTPGQSHALRVAGELGSARLSELAERLRIAPRSATEVVDALEQRGLVTRQPDPHDRRATCVVVSDEGDRLLGVLKKRRREATEAYLGGLDADDRAELDRILRLLL